MEPMELFDGAEGVPEEMRATIARNFERLIARTSLAAADMAMHADIVLVAEAADGSEERIRASSAILQRVSTGFRGMLQNCPDQVEIKLHQNTSTQRLHPVEAIRFVISVVHAEAANNEVFPTSGGLNVPAPPLGILLAACQFADCWDFPAVLRASARCLLAAVNSEDDMARKASSLMKLLRLAHGRSRLADWLPLLAATEEAIAQTLPLRWIPGVLKSFDLEQAARVINRIGDSKVELTPIELEGASMDTFTRAWHADPERTLWSSETARGDAQRQRPCHRQSERHGVSEGTFRLEVHLSHPDNDDIERAQRTLNDANQLLVGMDNNDSEMAETVRTLIEKTEDALKQAKSKKVGLYLRASQFPALLTGATKLWIRSDTKSAEMAYEIDEMHSGGSNIGRDDLVTIQELGSTATCTAGGTAVISKLQRQCVHHQPPATHTPLRTRSHATSTCRDQYQCDLLTDSTLPCRVQV